MSHKSLPKHAQVVVVGGGIIGCSVAYHLTKLGWTDVVVLERGQLTCGSTWHAAGLVMQLRSDYTMTELSRYGTNLYARLEEETGQATGFKQNGSLPIARTKERFTEIRRTASLAKCFGIDAHVLSPGEVKEHWPLLDSNQVQGGIFIPDDGQINPVDVTMALAKGARMRGAQFHQGVEVSGIATKSDAVTSVSTDKGDIQCEYVVNCAGIWAREFGRRSGVTIPVYAAEHMYVTTESLEGIPPTLPVLRDTDGYVYVKEDAGKLLVGSFEPQGKPLPVSRLAGQRDFIELAEDWDHFMLPMSKAIEMIPVLEDTGIRHFMNGPESFTPDNKFVIGEAPEVRNYFVAAGFNSQGILSGPGVGKAVAEWIVEGAPTMDLSAVDIARFHRFQSGRRFLQDRTGESLGLLYAMHWPFRQVESARPARMTPLHERVRLHGACFGEIAGWERANWYARGDVEPTYEYSYNRQNWFDLVGEEHRATREQAAIFDLSSFAKYLIEGTDACKELQRIAANNIDVEIGNVVYTAFLNHRAGFEADLTISRLSEQRFMVVSQAASQTRDLNWIRQHINGSSNVTLTDITSGLSTIVVAGPNSRQLLQAVSDADFSAAGFPFATARYVEVGYANVLAYRMSYVGELAWELYIPTEFSVPVFDLIVKHGETFGSRLAGYHALDSLRSECGYRHWGHDITPADTPIEAGLGFAVASKKEPAFIGKEAFLQQKDGGVKRRLVHFALKDPEPLLLHDEPIYRNGEIVGRITSGSYGYSVGRAVGMGYVVSDDIISRNFLNSGSYEIEIAGKRFAADMSLKPFHNPINARGDSAEVTAVNQPIGSAA